MKWSVMSKKEKNIKHNAMINQPVSELCPSLLEDGGYRDSWGGGVGVQRWMEWGGGGTELEGGGGIQSLKERK